MKRNVLVVGIALGALSFTSCKDAIDKKAEKTIDAYVVYVDSIEKLPTEDVKLNWQKINDSYQIRNSEADKALADMKDAEKSQERVQTTRAKYDAFKSQMEMNQDENQATKSLSNQKQQLRNALFGEGKIGEDLNFDWVNKDNIHSVYQQFIHTAENNKDNYSREDWDEVKVMYEALDSRKNTVEKEGLSSEDNRKIASLKLKFAPMLKVNRMGAKSDEMSEAKK